jgi:hypothetical protein
VVLRSISLGLALIAFSADADEGVERRIAIVQYLRTLTDLLAQPAPDQASTTTVVIGIRG